MCSVCLCAGTGCTNSILEAVARGVNAKVGVGISHVTVFYCEIQAFKQRFIRAHHGGDALIFKDVVARAMPRTATGVDSMCP
jgi:hypothetical protein